MKGCPKTRCQEPRLHIMKEPKITSYIWAVRVFQDPYRTSPFHVENDKDSNYLSLLPNKKPIIRLELFYHMMMFLAL